MPAKYRISVFTNVEFGALRDAERLGRMFMGNMEDLGYREHLRGDPGGADFDIFRKRPGRKLHELHLMFDQRGCSKTLALKAKENAVKVMLSLLLRFGFTYKETKIRSGKHGVLASLGWIKGDDSVYFELERMMDVRIDCCIAAA